ncbi:MAG: phosphopantetheine-binding protein [Erysipelotrichaceae bacterium]|nr:phosphopantetheine-binding protein [Erysipelotrichaceae bacterium]
MEKLIEILKGVCPFVDFEKEESIIEDHLIDSFDIISIIVELNDAYGVEISAEDITPENFNSAKSILELVEKAKEQ